jgi:hypothetical protein
MLHANPDSIFIGVVNQLLTTKPQRRASKTQITKLLLRNQKSSTMADPPLCKAFFFDPITAS